MRKYIYAIIIILLTVCITHAGSYGNRPWTQKIAEGAVHGYSFIEKFGECGDIDTTTTPEIVWSHGGLYTWSTTADIDRAVSSSTSDTHDLTIVGLDENWNEVQQVVTLTGQTPVALSTPLIRCYRAWNSNATDYIGSVHVFVDSSVTLGIPDDATKVRACITIEHTGESSGQTEMAIYTVPAGHIGYLYSGYVGISRGGNLATAVWTPQVRNYGGVFRTVYRGSSIGQGSSHLQQAYNPPIVLQPKSDFWIKVVDVGANDTGVFGGFTIILKDIYPDDDTK